ncbi:hypothetical protein KJ359_000550 [Pestalotiopsis sp. 9143b]|nr:hypothetical protein KJ359_000550 [Pestalotiopsis sp. 9143b]
MATFTPDSNLTAEERPRTSQSSSTSNVDPTHKRRASSPSRAAGDGNPRKAPKISRACDACKLKKTRCSGTRPCNRCFYRGMSCIYEAAYSRGKAPEPLPRETPLAESHAQDALESRAGPFESTTTTRNSPEFEHAEIEGRHVDPTSALTFLHRAHWRLLNQANHTGTGDHDEVDRPGDDVPQPATRQSVGSVSMPADAQNLVEFYFENCVVTYHMFHRQTLEGWLSAAINLDPGVSAASRIGNARASILLTIMAIATLRLAKMNNGEDVESGSDNPRCLSDHYFALGFSLTEFEADRPTLELAQAWLVQVLYLLQTARMNKAWYRLGAAYQVVVSLGLHHRSGRKRDEPAQSSPAFINIQCRRRTFWVAYTIDAYMSIVLGRPRYFHDEDISQSLPEPVNDEDMGPPDPDQIEEASEYDCNMDAVIAHARLAMIINGISRNVYAVRSIPKEARLAAAKAAGQELKTWYTNLAPHLRSVRPSSLIPSLRRQAVALKLAYHHALMHAYRPFLSSHDSEIMALGGIIDDCMASAKTVLQTVEAMAKDSTVFHAFWWTSYTIFCTLTIIYVWEIQQRTGGHEVTDENRKVFALAEKCHGLLAQSTSLDSPNRRYAVILEELRHEAQVQHSGATPVTVATAPDPSTASSSLAASGEVAVQPSNVATNSPSPMLAPACDMSQPFQEWQPMNWLELDASAFIPYPDINAPIDAYLQQDLA